MDTQIVVVFCLCDDLLKALHHPEDVQCRMTDAEVMTTAIVAMLYFKGNFCWASRFLLDYGYNPNMLSKRRLNRRLHHIADLFLTLFLRLGASWKQLNEHPTYIIDSFPTAVCDNDRIARSKTGEPVEFFLAPGSFSDTSALHCYNFDLQELAWILGGKAYSVIGPSIPEIFLMRVMVWRISFLAQFCSIQYH